MDTNGLGTKCNTPGSIPGWSTMTRVEMISKIAWAETQHSGLPRHLFPLMAHTHTEILGKLTTEEIKEYYVAMFGEQEGA